MFQAPCGFHKLSTNSNNSYVSLTLNLSLLYPSSHLTRSRDETGPTRVKIVTFRTHDLWGRVPSVLPTRGFKTVMADTLEPVRGI